MNNFEAKGNSSGNIDSIFTYAVFQIPYGSHTTSPMKVGAFQEATKLHKIVGTLLK